MNEVIAWNTGALYRKEGQRIAAERSGDRVVFVDYDRGLFYGTSEYCELTVADVMRCYLYNKTRHPPFEEGQRERLEAIAKLVKPI